MPLAKSISTRGWIGISSKKAMTISTIGWLTIIPTYPNIIPSNLNNYDNQFIGINRKNILDDNYLNAILEEDKLILTIVKIWLKCQN